MRTDRRCIYVHTLTILYCTQNISNARAHTFNKMHNNWMHAYVKTMLLSSHNVCCAFHQLLVVVPARKVRTSCSYFPVAVADRSHTRSCCWRRRRTCKTSCTSPHATHTHLSVSGSSVQETCSSFGAACPLSCWEYIFLFLFLLSVYPHAD